MNIRLLSLTLAALLCGAGCTPVRTVYDDQGNVVSNDKSGGEKDLMSVYEKKFNSNFKVKKNSDGVPQTVSNKMSHFQRDIDNARNSKSQFSTKNFKVSRNSDFRSTRFDDSRKNFDTSGETFSRSNTSRFAARRKPDFMNDSHGISHSDHYLDGDSRSRMEGQRMKTSRYRNTEGTPFQRTEASNYFESRRNKTEQPKIIDHQDTYQQYRQGIRELLGRDNPTP